MPPTGNVGGEGNVNGGQLALAILSWTIPSRDGDGGAHLEWWLVIERGCLLMCDLMEGTVVVEDLQKLLERERGLTRGSFRGADEYLFIFGQSWDSEVGQLLFFCYF
eukprot:TRINITY_DN4129_c0_g1_i1.p2 TRINITY_DN4129_c0_g1~~TRINITY_DN4129_c0_g1_i1.p2  ORF type:complete len:107 (-),score=9.93 TRINITY_DN4129_c0_g1_i1:177-497(-)